MTREMIVLYLQGMILIVIAVPICFLVIVICRGNIAFAKEKVIFVLGGK